MKSFTLGARSQRTNARSFPCWPPSPGREARAIQSNPAPRVRHSEAGRAPAGARS